MVRGTADQDSIYRVLRNISLQMLQPTTVIMYPQQCEYRKRYRGNASQIVCSIRAYSSCVDIIAFYFDVWLLLRWLIIKPGK